MLSRTIIALKAIADIMPNAKKPYIIDAGSVWSFFSPIMPHSKIIYLLDF